MRRALVIVGKAPEPGRAKTRLVPPLSEIEAAEVARAFLQDTCATALGLGWEQVSLVYAASSEFLGALGVRLLPQHGKGLGEALAGAFDDHADFDQIILIGSDTPDLPRAVLEQASRELTGHDAVIGPALDGGYYLLGLRGPAPRLFQDIAWSTDVVFAETLARAEALGLRVAVLPAWGDVDTPDDLVRLQRALRQAPPEVARNTRAVLRRLCLGRGLQGRAQRPPGRVNRNAMGGSIAPRRPTSGL